MTFTFIYEKKIEERFKITVVEKKNQFLKPIIFFY